MGVNLAPLISEYKHKIGFKDLANKAVAIDAYNTIYQFISIIRDPTGRPLRDRKGNVTSHLSGLFYRNINLLVENIKLVYVFDGAPPIRKMKELKRRQEIKEESWKKYLEAIERKDYEEARKYAALASKIEDKMVEDAAKLLELLGIPIVFAPGEAEAQAAHMVRKGDVWASGTQDYDSLLFGSVRVARNITLTGKQRLPSKGIEVKLEPEVLYLDEILSKLDLTREQLVDIGILIGTDYNDGVRGIGPKKAYSLIKKYGRIEDTPDIQDKISLDEVDEVRKLFLEPTVTDNYSLEFSEPNYDGIIGFLCDEHDFSIDRVTKALDSLKRAKSVKSLDQWFG
jgi:flap endonuclease-1